MSFTHTDAPARTNADTISAPTPLPPPVTSAVRPPRSIVYSDAPVCARLLTASGLHHHRDHDGTTARALGDEASERLARVAAHGLEVGAAVVLALVDRVGDGLLRLFEQL